MTKRIVLYLTPKELGNLRGALFLAWTDAEDDNNRSKLKSVESLEKKLEAAEKNAARQNHDER